MNCPNCIEMLKPVYVKGVALNVCEKCDGIWFDRNELSLIVNSTYEEISNSPISKSLDSNDTNHENSTSDKKCPCCSTSMRSYEYCGDSGVNLEICPTCSGIWVDDGEIKEIINYVQANNQPIPMEKMASIQSKLNKIEAECDISEKNILEGLVDSDEKSGLLGLPGKALQAIYKFFYKMGI